MSFWDWTENAAQKLGNTLKKAGDILWAGPGLAIDIARATADGPEGKTWGEALEKAADRYSGAADLLIDNGTITGWGVNQLAKGSEYVYREEITPLVSQPATYITHGVQSGDWSEDAFIAAGEANQTAGANGDDLTIAQSIALVGNTVGGKIGQATNLGEGKLLVDPLGDDPERKDWDDYQRLLKENAGKNDMVMSNVLTGSADAAATWYADPAYLALKPIGVLRQIRRDAPLTAKAAADVRAAMDRQSDVVAKTYGLGKIKGVLKSDQADRVEAVVGTFDEAGNYAPGYIRGLNSSQVYQAFPQLQEAPFGRQVATWLSRADRIEDDATRVGLQKDILAVSYGDLGALKNIQKLRNEGQKFADGLDSLPDEVDSALSGRVNGSSVGQAAEVAGLTPAWGAEVATVKEAKRLLKNIPGVEDVKQFEGALQGHTLVPTAKGARSLARVDEKGLLRDGTLNTGYEKLDAAGKALGIDKVAALASKTDEVLDDLAGRVKSGKHSGATYVLRNGLLSPAVQVLKKTAWDLPYQTTKFGYTASDRLRTKANPGLMNLFDVGHLGSVLDGEMRRTGLDDLSRSKLLQRLNEVAEGDTVTAKQIVEEAERGMFGSLAKKYGVREDYITELASQIQKRRDKFFTSIQDQQAQSFAPAGDHSGATLKLPDGTERPLQAHDYPTVIDEDGSILAVEPAPFWDTQRVHATSLTDFKELDKVLKRHGQSLRDFADDWYDTRRGKFGKRAYDAMWNPDGLDASYQVRNGLDKMQKLWKAGTLLRGGYTLRILGDDQIRMWSAGYGAAVWGRILKDGVPSSMRTRNGRLHKQLMAEREMLKDRVSDPDILAANKAEVDELRKLNAKIDRLDAKIAAAPRIEDIPDEFDDSGYEFFHGTSNKFDKLMSADMGKSADNLFGPGFYTTDDVTVADTYRAKGNGRNPGTYGVRWTGDTPPKMLDMDLPATRTVREWAEVEFNRFSNEDLENWEATPEALADFRQILDNSEATTAEVIRSFRKMVGSTGDVPTNDADALMLDLMSFVQQDGYDGLKHVGGVYTSSKRHNVSIFYNTSKLEATERTPLPKRDVRAELESAAEEARSRRDMLMEQGGNLGIYDDELRLTEVERMLREKDFSSLKDGKGIGTGRYKTSAGLDLNDAYGGTEGAMSKIIVENSNVIDSGVKGTETAATEFSLSSGSWRDVVPSERGHLDTWAHTVNRQIRNSKFAQILLDGGTAEDVLRFMRTHPDGKAIVRRMPHHASDQRRWAANMEEVIDNLLPTPELRALAAKRNLTKTDLEQAVPVLEQRPVVNGALADMNIGSGQVSSTMNKTFNKLFHLIAEIPTNAMSRHPLFITFYRREADRLSALYKENGLLVDGKVDLDTINRLEDQARKAAENRLRRTLFDTASASDAATTLRYLSPFFAAWQESMSRWGRIVADNPQVIRRFQMAFDAPRNLGLTVDEDGNLLEPGEFPEGNNRILLQLPHAWGGKDTRKAENRTGLSVGEASFNLIFNGGGVLNPGFGPFAQIPTNVLTERFANSKNLEHLSKAVSPYGPTTGVLDPLVPATVKRAATVYDAWAPWAAKNSAEFTFMETTILQEKVVDFQLAEGRAPSKTEQRKLEKEAENEAQNMAIWRFVNNAVSPAPANFQGKYEGLRQEYRRFQDEAQAQGKEIGWADEQFRKKYGFEFFVLTRSRSNNPGQVAASNETIEGVKFYGDEMKLVDPKMYRMILGEKNKQGFSTAAYRFLQNEGVISKKDGRDAVSDAIISQGWVEYRKAMTLANGQAAKMGLKSYRDDERLTSFMKLAKDAIGEENPQWYEDLTSFNPSEYDGMLKDMKAVAGMGKLNSDPLRAGGQQALGQYLQAREMVGKVLEQRTAEGGASTIQAEANADLQTFMDMVVSSLMEESLDFERYYYPGIVERDPWLSDTFNAEEEAEVDA